MVGIILLGGLSIVRLFSWSSLVGIDRFFYVFSVLLFVFASYLVILLRIPEPVVHPIVVDDELVNLREEVKKVVPPIVEPIIPSKAEREREFHRLENDTSMYDDVPIVEKRNIIKPPEYKEDKEVDDNQYRGVF